MTRNRCRRLAARGEVQLRDLCNHANQLIVPPVPITNRGTLSLTALQDTLRSIAADRQLKERACIDPALHLIRQTIEVFRFVVRPDAGPS